MIALGFRAWPLRSPLFLVAALILTVSLSASASQLLLPTLGEPSGWTVPAGQTLNAGEEPAPGSIRSIEWSFDVEPSSANGAQIVHDGLDLLPADVFMFRVKPGASYLNIALTDLDGTVAFACQLGLSVGAWQRIELPLTPESREESGGDPIFFPRIMAPGEDGQMGRIQKVVLGIDHRAGEFWGKRNITYLFGDFRVRLLDSAELQDYLRTALQRVNDKLDQAQEQLDGLDAAIEAADAGGLDTAFAQASSMVATHTVHWAQMDADYALEHGAPIFMADAERQADYLLESLPRAFADLQQVLESGTAAVPAADMTKMGYRKGNFYASERPIIITGLQSPVFDYEELRRGGYNGVSQHEFGLGAVVNEDGTINMASVQGVVATAQKAAASNLCLDQLLTIHSLPDWMYEQYPDIDPDGFRRGRNPFMPWNVDSHGFRSLVETFVNASIPALAECPNVASYDLVNELWYAEHNDYPAAAWREFLSKRYFDVGQLNAAWGTSFTGFDEPAAQLDSPAGHKDFADFNAQRVARFLEWESALIRKHDRHTPCYAKVHGGGVDVLGADKQLLGEVLDAQGADCFPTLKFDADAMEADFWTQAMICDLYRSLRDKPIIDSEYHVVSSVPYEAVHEVSADFVRTMLWQGALHGRDAAHIWIAQRRGACAWVPYEDEDGDPHGDHLFLTLPWAMQGAARAAIELERYAEAVQEFQEQTSEVALLYAGPDVKDTYQAMYFLDAPFRFVTDEQIQDGALEQGEIKVLIAPPRAPIGDEGFRNVVEFALGGGTVAVGEDAFTRDDYGRPRDLSDVGRPEAIQILRRSPDGPAVDKPIAAEIDAIYEAGRVRRPFRAALADSEERPGRVGRHRATGVELRAERTGRYWLVYLINFNKQPVEIELEGLREDAALVNLFDGRDVETTFTLQPLQPLLMRVERRAGVASGA